MGRTLVMQVTDTDWKGSLVEILETISDLEDKEPRKGTKAHIEWKKKLVAKCIEYNNRVGWKAFNET